MKKLILILMLGSLFTGCARVKYTNWRGDNVFQGDGGSVEIVNEVEIWENGAPNAKYKIVGVIDYKGRDALIQNKLKHGRLTKKALEYGADGLILMNDELLDAGTYTQGKSNENTKGTINTNPYLPGWSSKSTTNTSGTSTILRDKIQKYYAFKYIE